jgi:CheY-like chemotaxis protein
LAVTQVSPPSETGTHIRFQVTDTGMGIVPEALEDIFSPFYQESRLSSKVEGTGLGLAISRHLVELMGGELQVKSTPAQGSTFWFDLVLPVAAVEVPAIEETSPLQAITGFKGGPLKILIADDQPENRAVLNEILSPLGFTIIQAANGQEVVDRVSAALPDLVLMDLMMPLMDGFEVIRQIRQRLTPEDITLIIISASVDDHTREQCIKAGANDFLVKPIQLDNLFTCLENHLKLQWLYAPPPPPETNLSLVSKEVVFPPVGDLLKVRDLAQDGFITGLEQFLTTISQANEAYRPFAEQVRRLTDQFEFAEIITLIDQYLENRDS